MSEQQPLIRDMDLVRDLLMWSAQHARRGATVRQPGSNIHSHEVVAYTISIMVEEGLLKGVFFADGSWGMGVLTWKGQDFLQAASNDSVWNKAKQKAGDVFTLLPLDILLALLKQVLKERIGLDS